MGSLMSPLRLTGIGRESTAELGLIRRVRHVWPVVDRTACLVAVSAAAAVVRVVMVAVMSASYGESTVAVADLRSSMMTKAIEAAETVRPVQMVLVARRHFVRWRMSVEWVDDIVLFDVRHKRRRAGGRRCWGGSEAFLLCGSAQIVQENETN